ncbi:MAG: hypothetical protein GX494_06300 [Clostridiaceae bacterium]|nr:hypothetical protein [Clostridiaceae bacterium]
MARKLIFAALLFILIIAGSVVSMADEDNNAVINNNTNIEIPLEADGNALNNFTVNIPEYEAAASGTENAADESYSAEAVLEKYGSLFFDEEVQSDIEFISIINIEHDGKSKNVGDYVISALVSNEADLDYDESLILMIFIKKDNKFELLTDPVEGYAWFLTKVSCPNIGKDNPNHIRFIVFPKNNYKNLELNVNLQITDMEHVIIAPSKPWEKVKKSLLNMQQSLEYLFNKINESE